MTAVPQTPVAELLDRIAQQDHYDDESAQDCTVCRLVAALQAVLAKCDAMAREAPKPQVGGFMADEFRSVVAAALTDGTPR